MMNEKKFYVSDNGFIHAVSTRFSKDSGWLLENLVFNCLGEAGVFYHSGKKECDFVILSGNRIGSAVQVTWELDLQNEARELDGLLSAMNEYELSTGMILTYDQEDERNYGSKKIIIKPVWKWLLEPGTVLPHPNSASPVRLLKK